MTILDLLKLCSYQDVEKELESHYSEVDTEKFRRLYVDLGKIEIKNLSTKSGTSALLSVECRRIEKTLL